MSLDFYLRFDIDTGNVPHTAVVYEANYTHNVSLMWRHAGVYDALYWSEGKTARDVVDVLWAGVQKMHASPETYQEMNPPNGWGNYDSALEWLQKTARACQDYPKAIIGVSR